MSICAICSTPVFRRPFLSAMMPMSQGWRNTVMARARACRHMVYITVSTGIGTGVIVDNRMLLGRQGLAAEIGHMTIDASMERAGEP